jgi:hypothetical protein
MGFGMVIGFIEHLQMASTSNYSAITYLIFTVCCVFTSRCLVTDLNNVLCFCAHVLTSWQLSQTNSLLSCPAYNLLFPIVAAQTCLFAKPLLSNGCCIFAYLAVIARQWFCMPQYL